MKRFLSLIIATTLSLSLISCDNTETDGQEGTTTETGVEEEGTTETEEDNSEDSAMFDGEIQFNFAPYGEAFLDTINTQYGFESYETNGYTATVKLSEEARDAFLSEYMLGFDMLVATVAADTSVIGIVDIEHDDNLTNYDVLLSSYTSTEKNDYGMFVSTALMQFSSTYQSFLDYDLGEYDVTVNFVDMNTSETVYTYTYEELKPEIEAALKMLEQ